MKQYVVKDSTTGKYYPSGNVDWPFVESLSDARVFAERTSALYVKHADVPRPKQREKDPNDQIPNLEIQPVSLHDS